MFLAVWWVGRNVNIPVSRTFLILPWTMRSHHNTVNFLQITKSSYPLAPSRRYEGSPVQHMISVLSKQMSQCMHTQLWLIALSCLASRITFPLWWDPIATVGFPHYVLFHNMVGSALFFQRALYTVHCANIMHSRKPSFVVTPAALINIVNLHFFNIRGNKIRHILLKELHLITL